MNYICGGKLGDLIHVLWVVRRYYELHGVQGNIFLTNDSEHGGDTFSRPLDETYNELMPLLALQPYIASVQMLIGPLSEPIINLNEWRQFLSYGNWFDILSVTYSLPLPQNKVSKWIEYPKEPLSKWSTCVVIHRSLQRHNDQFPWEDIVRNHECVFVTSNVAEYEAFPWKHMVKCHVAKDIYEMTGIIANSCFFIGNMSFPLAIAVSLGYPCLAELYYGDADMYISAPMCDGKMFWFLEPCKLFTMGMDKYLPLKLLHLPVSIGEGLDKLSILQIKLKYIKDTSKLENIKRELDAITPTLQTYVDKVPQQFALLQLVNECIWNLCDVARAKGTTDAIVMRENDARFRVKKKINLLCNSYLQEQKSFDENVVFMRYKEVLIKETCEDAVRRMSTYYDKVYLNPDWPTEVTDTFRDDPWIILNKS
jgi:hypothetical protein